MSNTIEEAICGHITRETLRDAMLLAPYARGNWDGLLSPILTPADRIAFRRPPLSDAARRDLLKRPDPKDFPDAPNEFVKAMQRWEAMQPRLFPSPFEDVQP